MDEKQYPTQPAATVVPPSAYPTVYTTQPIIIAPAVAVFCESPIQMQCPSCRATIVTRTTYKSGLLTWLVCGGICLFGCWLGCQFIPFCIDGCKDVDHSCPNCNAFLGTYKRI